MTPDPPVSTGAPPEDPENAGFIALVGFTVARGSGAGRWRAVLAGSLILVE